MNVWFIRAGANTAHNNPATVDYVPGEPPTFPETYCNYHDKCLSDGFVRISWPNTGDLMDPGRGRLAAAGYSFEDLNERRRRYLTQFTTIRTGDLVLMPAYTELGEVHVGVVVLRDRATREVVSLQPGLPAYYYHHDIPRGEWYECAHRVDVLWDWKSKGVPGIHHIAGLAWLLSFCAVEKGRARAIEAAKSVGLPVAEA